MKQRSLQLIDEGWEMEDIANVLGVASKSIKRWTDNYDMHGRVDPPSVLRTPCFIFNWLARTTARTLLGLLLGWLDKTGLRGTTAFSAHGNRLLITR
jgi:hypothetical protein